MSKHIYSEEGALDPIVMMTVLWLLSPLVPWNTARYVAEQREGQPVLLMDS